MIPWLLRIGLIVTPFILAPGQADEARAPKMAWAVAFALAIGLTAVYRGKLKPLKNIWAPILVAFSLLSFYLSPKPVLGFFGIQSGRFWSWEPLYYFLVFFLFFAAVSSIRFSKRQLHLTMDVMIWCGLVMAAYVMFQSVHLDQFFEHRFCKYGYMAGTLGNPVFVGPFLCMVFPLALVRRRFFFASLMVAASVVTHSDIAWVGMLAVILTFYALNGKREFITTAVFTALFSSGVLFLYFTTPDLRARFPDNERFLTWGQSLNDVSTPVMQNSKKTYVITGIGPGSYMYLFHAKNNQRNDNFLYAHNDYVQVIYELGAAGGVLFLTMVAVVFYQTAPVKRLFSGREIGLDRRALITSFVGICVCAAGLFVWQIGTHIFYSLTIVGLLYNPSVAIGDGDSHA